MQVIPNLILHPPELILFILLDTHPLDIQLPSILLLLLLILDTLHLDTLHLDMATLHLGISLNPLPFPLWRSSPSLLQYHHPAARIALPATGLAGTARSVSATTPASIERPRAPLVMGEASSWVLFKSASSVMEKAGSVPLEAVLLGTSINDPTALAVVERAICSSSSTHLNMK